MLNLASSSVVDQSCVVKKVCFRASMLPIVAILSSLIIHLAFIGLLFAMFGYYGFVPGRYAIQVPYYAAAMVLLLLGLSWLTSSLTVFLRDVPQIVGVLLQFGFWATPIFWQPDLMPAGLRWLIRLNPMYYIIQGYRDSLIHGRWFWEDSPAALGFWGFTLVCFVLGGAVFTRPAPPLRRLARPQGRRHHGTSLPDRPEENAPQPAIEVRDLAKVYRLYDRPLDRLKEALDPLRRRSIATFPPCAA